MKERIITYSNHSIIKYVIEQKSSSYTMSTSIMQHYIIKSKFTLFENTKKKIIIMKG